MSKTEGDITTMNNKIERQVEKELEKFIEQNWKIILPVIGVIVIIWWVRRQVNKLSPSVSEWLPYLQKGSIFVGSVIGIILTLCIVRMIIIRKREVERYRYFRLLPRTNQEVISQDVHQLMKQLASVKRGRRKRFLRGREWIQYLIYRGDEDISFYIGYPKDLQNEMIKTFQNTYPSGEIHPVKEVPLPSKGSFSGRMKVQSHKTKQWLPFTSYQGGDQVGNLLSYMPNNTWISLTFSSESRKKIGKKLFKSEKELRKDRKFSEMYSFQKEEFKDITNRLTGDDKVFRTVISISGEGKKRKDIIKSVGKNISTVLNNKNLLFFRRHPNSITFCPHPRTRLLYLTNKELGNLVHLPSMTHTISEKIPKLEVGQHHLDDKTLNKGVTIGYNLHPLVTERPVKISFEQLTEHFFLSGMTGSGKSSALVMMLQSIIDEWLKKPNKTPTFTFVDPAGTTVRTVLNRLLKSELEGHSVPWEKVIYISYKNSDFPVGMNLLHKNEGEDTDTVVSNAMALFKTIYKGDKTRIDKYLSNALTSLIDDQDNHHVLSINRFLTDNRFRNKIVNRSQDELLKDFWRGVDEKELRMVSNDIYSRLNNFEQSIFMRRLFGQSRWDLPIQKFMDDGYIVLMDVQGLGKVNTQFICGHLINQYHQICQRRQAYASKEHLFIVDESHLVQIPTLEKIISEDRKFGLSLGLSTQYFNQYEDWLRQGIDGNVQNIISGSQGGTESKIMSDILMKKQFDSDLIAALPNNRAAVLTKNADKSLTTCLVKTEPPYLYKRDGSRAVHKNTHDINEVESWVDEKGMELQSQIGRPSEEIDQEINSYFGFGQKVDPQDEIFGDTGGKEKVKENHFEENETTIEDEEESLSDQNFGIMGDEKKSKETEIDKKREVDTQDAFL
ncbi:hypothetical protein [Priestia megaterium]|uniref:hypothetical protein n=1 Tax=Priestia megaterium TaxID=1404 RepID=UPI00159BBC10|nr:hypothetical protein [Priestia megaterium]